MRSILSASGLSLLMLAVSQSRSLASEEKVLVPAGATRQDCAASADLCGYPSMVNTGVPAGTALAPLPDGTLHITADDTVIDRLYIRSGIVVDARNVTITNSRIEPVADFNAITITGKATGTVIANCELAGNGKVQNGILGPGTFLRNNIHGFENGINTWGPAHIQDNYIHGMAGGAEAHFDGIEINQGMDITIRHNTVINQQNQTSAIMLDNWAGGVSHVTIDDNLLIGGGYTIYLDDRFAGGIVDDGSIAITRNRIGAGVWGSFALYDNQPVMSGNVELNRADVAGFVGAAQNN